LTDNSG